MNFNPKKKVMNMKTGKVFMMTESAINHLKKTESWVNMEIMPDLPPQVTNVTQMPAAEKPAKGKKAKAEEIIETKEETQTSNPEQNEAF